MLQGTFLSNPGTNRDSLHYQMKYLSLVLPEATGTPHESFRIKLSQKTFNAAQTLHDVY